MRAAGSCGKQADVEYGELPQHDLKCGLELKASQNDLGMVWTNLRLLFILSSLLPAKHALFRFGKDDVLQKKQWEWEPQILVPGAGEKMVPLPF